MSACTGEDPLLRYSRAMPMGINLRPVQVRANTRYPYSGSCAQSINDPRLSKQSGIVRDRDHFGTVDDRGMSTGSEMIALIAAVPGWGERA